MTTTNTNTVAAAAPFTVAFGEALAKVVAERHGQLVATARAVLRETSAANEAEDCVSRAFVAALTRSEQFRGEAAMATWLTVAVANAAKDLARSGAHSKRAMTTASNCKQGAPVRGGTSTGVLKSAPVWVQSDVTPKGFPSPLQTLLTKEALRRAVGALADLDEDVQAAHTMVRREGRSQAVAAASLGVSQPTLSRMLRKADAALVAIR